MDVQAKMAMSFLMLASDTTIAVCGDIKDEIVIIVELLGVC